MAAIIEIFYGGLLADWFLLLVEGVGVAVAHVALRLLFCLLHCFACYALRSAHCMSFARPGSAIGGHGLYDACNSVKHGISL